MEKEEFKKKDFELRYKIAFLTKEEKCDRNNPIYKDLEKLHKEYRESLVKERENEIYDKHKRK